MKIYCTGANGKIGQRLLKKGILPLECDVTDLASVEKAVEQAKPEVICHLAGYSDVDFCELPENKEKVIKTNLRGTWNVALAASAYHSGVVLLSSDHVFDGKRGPYKETDHPKNPVNFYGMSKMAAEALQTEFKKNMKIVRTSYLFNQERIHKGFLALDSWEYATFMHRSFMYEGHFAEGLYNYLLRFDMMPPILHISGSDTVSWYEFALAVGTIFRLDKSKIMPRRKEWKVREGDAFVAPRPKKAGLKTNLSAKFLRQYSYIDGLNVIRNEMP